MQIDEINIDKKGKGVEKVQWDNQSHATISSNNSNKYKHKLTYSQATSRNIRQNDDEDTEMQWINMIQTKLASKITESFNMEIWNYNKILESLQSKQGIEEFIKYKLMHKPTDLYIPNAINTKFRYLNTAFFIIFTRNKAA